MLKDDVLKELNPLMDENVIAFFSVTLKRLKDGRLSPTVTEFGGLESLTLEERGLLSNAIIDLAPKNGQVIDEHFRSATCVQNTEGKAGAL